MTHHFHEHLLYNIHYGIGELYFSAPRNLFIKRI